MYRGFVGTFFSHCLSLLSTLWAIISVSDGSLQGNDLTWIRLSFLFVMANCCLAMVRYGSSSGYKLKGFHICTLNLSTNISFTIIELVLYNLCSSPDYIKYLLFLNIIPFSSHLSTKDYRTKIKLSDAFIAINSLSLCILSFFKQNYFSIALNLSYLFGYFFIGECGFLFDTELPSIDAYQYLTCFLNIFTVYALSN